jgi:hypothetical protein
VVRLMRNSRSGHFRAEAPVLEMSGVSKGNEMKRTEVSPSDVGMDRSKLELLRKSIEQDIESGVHVPENVYSTFDPRAKSVAGCR